MTPRLIRSEEEGIQFLSRRPMTLTTDALGVSYIDETPVKFGEPTFCDWTFGPALNWVFEVEGKAFVVYTNLDGEYQIDVDRNANWVEVDEFVKWIEEQLR